MGLTPIGEMSATRITRSVSRITGIHLNRDGEMVPESIHSVQRRNLETPQDLQLQVQSTVRRSSRRLSEAQSTMMSPAVTAAARRKSSGVQENGRKKRRTMLAMDQEMSGDDLSTHEEEDQEEDDESPISFSTFKPTTPKGKVPRHRKTSGVWYYFSGEKSSNSRGKKASNNAWRLQ